MNSFDDLLCFRLGVLARRLQRYYNNLYDPHGITLGQSFILFHLLLSGGSSVKDIARGVRLDSPAITGFIDRLEKEDLVARKPDPNDRRSLRIELTSPGRRLAEELVPVALDFDTRLRELLGPAQLAAFETTLERIDCMLKNDLSGGQHGTL